MTAWKVIFGLVYSAFIAGAGQANTVQNSNSVLPPITQDSSSGGLVPSEQLAKCLSEKGARMYGAYWCPHCADQKNVFGDSFQYIKYTECDPKGPNPDTQSCQQAELTRYPTWTIPGGKDLIGTQSLQALSEWSTCSI